MAQPSIARSSCRKRQRLAGRHAQLQLDEIEAGDRLGNRVLHLQARVHLHEPEAVLAQPAGAVGDELDRARAAIADGAGRLDRRPPMAARTAGGMPGAGASSITFWWRRCSEQSRSNRWTTLPWASPKTCTSIWRGFRRCISRSGRPDRRSWRLAPRA
jgi:hypothetical protein